MARIRLRDSLHYRLARAAALLAVLLGVAVSGYQIALDFVSERERIERTVMQMLASMRESAAAAAYEIDGRYAGQLVAGLLEYRAIASAEIRDDFGEVLAALGRSDRPQEDHWLAARLLGDPRTFVVPLRVEGRLAPIGTLTVEIDAGEVAADFTRRAQLTLATEIVKSLALALILFLLFDLGISRPLLETVRELARFSINRRASDPLEIAIARRDDELGLLGRRFVELWLQRDRAEEENRQAMRVFECTADAIVITSADARIVAVNRAFSAITGYAETEVLGKNPRLLRSDRHDAAYFAQMWQDLNDHGLWRGEIWNRRKSGEIYPALLSISAVRDARGEITHYVSTSSDISSLKSSQERLDFMAHHDPLTGLPNRLMLDIRLDHSIALAARQQGRIAVLFVDLDRFKNINDSLGHPVGDEVLKLAARRLEGVVRREDTVTRLGGDEFIIVLEELHGENDAARVAEKTLAIFAEPFEVGGHELFLGASIGISLYPGDGTDGITLIKNADAAMFRAKSRGRNTFQFYTPQLTEVILDRVQMESDLRRALKADEFVLHYQPQFDVTTRALVGAEALVRWHHPERGLIMPDQFIHLAEETGLILDLGAYVLRRACEQLVAWERDGLRLETVAVNLSPRQIYQRGLVETVARTLDQTGCPPARLELEITEGFVMQSVEISLGILRELRELGVSLAIDDFGTGYSSLSYLKRLPVNSVKIDKSFVQDLPDDPDSGAIAKAIIAVGHNLQMRVVAEGAENEAQLAFLAANRCDRVQGFHLGRPLPPAPFAELIDLDTAATHRTGSAGRDA